MEKVFEKYIRAEIFIGQLYYDTFLKVSPKSDYSDFVKFENWYKDESNKEIIVTTLERNNIDFVLNRNQFINNFMEAKKTVKAQLPTEKSFEYIGMFHDS